MGKKPQDTVDLPEGWWPRLRDLCRSRWQHDAPMDIYEFTGVSRRSFQNSKKSGTMTESLFFAMAENLGFGSHQDLLDLLQSRKSALRAASSIPTSISLETQKCNPQWADYRAYLVGAVRPWALLCKVTTESPYFRFGFKLLGPDGRVFGDGSIKSHDENMIVHIGRNNWDRPGLGISAKDIFLTCYMSGNFLEDRDRCLFQSEAKLAAAIELRVDENYCVTLAVNRRTVFRQIVSPEICRRVALYAWGDREEFRVDVTDLIVQSV